MPEGPMPTKQVVNVAYKHVCPMQEIVRDYTPDDAETITLGPCHADLYMDHRSRAEFGWWARDGVVDELYVGSDVGEGWWQIVCEAGHVLLTAMESGGDGCIPYQPWMIAVVVPPVPTMRTTDPHMQQWEIVT